MIKNNGAPSKGQSVQRAADPPLQELYRQFREDTQNAQYEEEFFRAVHRHVLTCVGDKDTAQEVMMTILTRCPEKLPPEKFEHWLNKVCRHRRYKVWRKRQADPTESSEKFGEANWKLDEAVANSPAPEFPGSKSQQRECEVYAAASLMDEVAGLPLTDRERELLQAMREHGANRAAVARAFGITRQRTGQLWKRLREKIRLLAGADERFRGMRNPEWREVM